MTQMTEFRRATDGDEPTNKEVQSSILERLTRLERLFDSWKRDHDELHRDEAKEFRAHLLSSVERDKDIDALEALPSEVRDLHDFRIKVETMSKTVELIAGMLGRVQWVAIAAVVISIIVLIVEAFVPHVSGVPVIKP